MCVYRHVHSGTHAYPHHAGVKAWCGTWLAGPSLSPPAPCSPKPHSSCKMLSKAPPACPGHNKQAALPFQLPLPSPLPHPHPDHLLLSALAGSPGPTCPVQCGPSPRLCSQAACLLPRPVLSSPPQDVCLPGLGAGLTRSVCGGLEAEAPTLSFFLGRVRGQSEQTGPGTQVSSQITWVQRMAVPLGSFYVQEKP